jgi:ComF family protein
MKLAFTYFIDFFLPRFCPGCNKKLSPNEEPVCEECLSSLLVTDEEKLSSEYEKNFGSSNFVDDYFAAYIFEIDKTLQHIIHALKYKKQFKLGIFLGETVGEKVKTLNWPIDIIIPVPIHHLKKVERGFNQSDFIAMGLTNSLKIPNSTRIVKRIRHTETQTRLNMKERAKNVADAFKVRKPKKIEGKNVLLVDDVCTTGATILECAKMLKSAGAVKVFACTVGTTSFENEYATFSQVRLLQE